MPDQVVEDAYRPRRVGLRTRLHYSIYSSRAGFQLLKAQRCLAHPVELRRRRRAGQELIARLDAFPRIDPALGYRWIEPGDLPGIDALVASCRGAIAEARPHVPRLVDTVPGRFRIAFDVLGDDRVHARPELVDAMVSDELLACAADYLGAVPVLRRIAIGYSPGNPSAADPAWAGSQLIHFDGEDDRQIKLFVLLTDVVDERHGPLTFLPAAASREATRILGGRPLGPVGSYMRAGPYSDEQVRAVVDPSDFITMTGRRGRVLLLDTSSTLHQGSRVHHGHERIVFMGVLQRYHLVHATPSNWFDASRFAPGTPQRLALTPPDPRPRNYFFPDPLVAGAATERRGAA